MFQSIIHANRTALVVGCGDTAQTEAIRNGLSAEQRSKKRNAQNVAIRRCDERHAEQTACNTLYTF
jgi:hypothetical protein